MCCLGDQHEFCGDFRFVRVPRVQCLLCKSAFSTVYITIKHMTACDFSLQKSVHPVEIFFQIAVVKISIQSNENSTIMFLIV